MWKRLRADSQLAIIMGLGVFAIVGIVPFAIYRFSIGNPQAGTIDLAIAAAIGLALAHAWRSSDRRLSSLFLALINTVGCLASASILGPPGLFWMYPALLGNFLLLNRNAAVLVTAAALTFLTVQGAAYESSAQLAVFLVSASVSSLVAYVFASRTDAQQRKLWELATLDPLTGVSNRRAMEQELQIAVEEHRRGHSTFGLAMLDLDHFKRINDQHGHEAGDEVLVEFANLVRRSTRKVDRCFRYGGEEFVLLMPAANPAALHALDATLRSRIAAELSYRGETVTVSVGVTALRADEDWQAWLARADSALYRAKKEGRNCTVVDQEQVA